MEQFQRIPQMVEILQRERARAGLCQHVAQHVEQVGIAVAQLVGQFVREQRHLGEQVARQAGVDLEKPRLGQRAPGRDAVANLVAVEVENNRQYFDETGRADILDEARSPLQPEVGFHQHDKGDDSLVGVVPAQQLGAAVDIPDKSGGQLALLAAAFCPGVLVFQVGLGQLAIELALFVQYIEIFGEIIMPVTVRGGEFPYAAEGHDEAEHPETDQRFIGLCFQDCGG